VANLTAGATVPASQLINRAAVSKTDMSTTSQIEPFSNGRGGVEIDSANRKI
jgi:hypothetical protein